MHIFGKICAWMVVIAAGAALGLTAKLLDARGAWLRENEKLKTANIASAEKLEKSEKDRATAEAELSRELLRWERYWDKTPAAFIGEGDQAALQADIGFAQRLGSAEGTAQPVVYAFPLAEDGTSTYAGPFQVVEARENQSAMKPAYRVRNADPLGAANTWRFRSMIPDANKTRFLDLETQLLVADERLKKEESNLAVQTQLVETAKQHRDFRLAELLGGENIPEGLMTQIAKLEEARNLAQAKVDQLRRELSDAVAHLQELAAKNKETVRSMAGQELKPAAETADAGRN